MVYKAITEPQAHWLVPIQCSPTLFSHLDDTPSTALYSINLLPDNPPSSQSNRIYWTYHSLVSFWVFLLEVRKRNKFGPLAITYLYNSPELAFVKITCDTPNVMRFRTVLRSWRCQMDANDPPPSTVEKEVLNSSASARPLKFARLLLVDESGDNLLIA
ncbi:hypothetical protein SISNIDRAFT_291564 [Sistotremastrum niveocremeum HHB9708]|uniref:Uncharacterized protein n=1 Tax=Sistotremastrum niveocremeum HHB9708 TaxID=1314777 RepID=A0A164YJY8_9AGAM|nr:hypothetical protein SISNIDRAFT_291564 [Sistotremastrum niveocremeum HHB9708]